MIRTAAVLVLSFLFASGCEGAGDGALSEVCLPVQAPVYPEAAPQRMPVPEATSIYIDTSLSVTYFGKAPSVRGRSPFVNLMLWVTSSGVGERAALFGFSNSIAPIDAQVVRQISEGTDSPCRACGFQETRLDLLMEKVAQDDPEALTLAMTDLWFMSNEVQGSAAVALRRGVQSVFDSGRAIGILGFEAGYNERVFDLPGAPTLAKDKISSRPFFVLIIGQPHMVESTAAQLRREVFEETPDVAVNFAMFSPEIVARPPAMISFLGNLPYTGTTGRRIAWEAIEIPKVRADMPLDRISFHQGNVIDASIAPTAVEGDIIGPEASLGQDWAFDSTPQISEFEITTKSWVDLGGQTCALDNWDEVDFSDILKRTGPSTLQLDLMNSELMTAQEEWMLLSFEVSVQGLEDNSPATRWLRDWSFSRLGDAHEPGVSVDLSDPPEFFPALNLAAFARVLREEAEIHINGKTVGHGHVLIKAE